MISFILGLVFAGLAGYFAGKIMHCNFSILKSVLIGLVGGFVGGILFGLIGMGSTSIIGGIIISTVGACVCIWAARKFLK